MSFEFDDDDFDEGVDNTYFNPFRDVDGGNFPYPLDVMIPDIPNEEYHGYKEFISASNLKDLIKKPYMFFNPIDREDNYNFDIGSMIHCLILEPENFDKEFAVAPKVDLRTTKGKKVWADFVAEHDGKIIIKSDDYENCSALAKSVLANEYVQKLLEGGVSEVSMFREMEFDGVMYKGKCRPDRYIPDRRTIVDVKSCVDASPKAFARDIAKFGYHIQAPWYKELSNVDTFIFLAVEKTAPYMVGIYELDLTDEELGLDLCKKALLISRQPENYEVPMYKGKRGEIVQTIMLPSWVHYENENL